MEKELLNKIKYLIRKKNSLKEIVEDYALTGNDIAQLTEYLNYKNDKIILSKNHILYDDSDVIKETIVNVQPHLQEIKICLISDTHLAAKFDRLDLLDYIYEKCERKGIKHVFHSGDIVEGTDLYDNGKAKHLKENTFNGQLEYVLEYYPKYNGYTYLINGNHDLRWFNEEGKNIAKSLSEKRDDFIYLGDKEAIANINNIKLLVVHNIKKECCDINGMSLVQGGHIHVSDNYLIDDIPHFQTAALIDMAPYKTGFKRMLERSCWFLSITIDDRGNIYYITKELEKFDKDVRVLKKC